MNISIESITNLLQFMLILFLIVRISKIEAKVNELSKPFYVRYASYEGRDEEDYPQS